MISKPIFNRAPLPANERAPLPLTAIRPEGWLRKQLELAAQGLTGKLYEFWPDVSENCGWLGGSGDGWERAPYYLDGLLPLAYILEDEHLKAVCQRYIEWTLGSQRQDGWFGPDTNDDWWPRMVMLKVLQQYYTATMDKRVLSFMGEYFKYQYRHIDGHPLKEWAVARAAENMQVALWLYNLTGAKFLIELCKKLNGQALDWTGYFHTFPNVRSMKQLMPWNEKEQHEREPLLGADHPYLASQYHFSHVVNVAMGLKYPAIVHQFKSGVKEQQAFEVGYQKLMRYHGVASGIFTGDEHLSGNSPTQGTECCAVVELMHTLETLLGTGDFGDEVGDILEKMAFNALPATLTKDLMAHQYDQQVNQVRVSVDRRAWYNNDDTANLYGLEPHFGCCTANMHQGWPKYAASLWYATRDGGLAAVSYAPCTVRYAVKDVPVRVSVDTAYPFEQAVRITVSVKRPVEFPVKLRIPTWADEAALTLPDGSIMSVEPGKYAVVQREWQGGENLVLSLPMKPKVSRWHHHSAAVHVGPLLMAFQPKERWEKVKEHPVAPDWAVYAESPWNWALYLNQPMSLEMDPGKAAPFGWGEAVKLKVKAARVPDWGMEGASCGQTPIAPKVDEGTVQEITLVPYGDTGLRIGQFPVAAE